MMYIIHVNHVSSFALDSWSSHLAPLAVLVRLRKTTGNGASLAMQNSISKL